MPKYQPALRLSGLLAAAAAVIWAATAIGADEVDPNIIIPEKILGSKHDFTGLNRRAGVTAMPGLAFSDYGTPCIYCHIPPDEEEIGSSFMGGIPGWNRFRQAGDAFSTYDSRTLDNKVRTPSSISLLCLSCHDGTMAVDMTVFKPDGWDSAEDAALHLKLNGADDLESCGKCHNGNAAHSIAIKHIGTDLTNDHPISMEYAGLNFRDPDFRPPDTPFGFRNGIKLYDNRVECATCHNVHEPDVKLLLRVGAEQLCETCHIK